MSGKINGLLSGLRDIEVSLKSDDFEKALSELQCAALESLGAEIDVGERILRLVEEKAFPFHELNDEMAFSLAKLIRAVLNRATLELFQIRSADEITRITSEHRARSAEMIRMAASVIEGVKT